MDRMTRRYPDVCIIVTVELLRTLRQLALMKDGTPGKMRLKKRARRADSTTFHAFSRVFRLPDMSFIVCVYLGSESR